MHSSGNCQRHQIKFAAIADVWRLCAGVAIESLWKWNLKSGIVISIRAASHTLRKTHSRIKGNLYKSWENKNQVKMGAHSSKEKLSRSYSERYIHSQMIERERFGSFGKRASKGLTKGEFSGFTGGYS